jgi:hypothetical protein
MASLIGFLRKDDGTTDLTFDSTPVSSEIREACLSLGLRVPDAKRVKRTASAKPLISQTELVTVTIDVEASEV